MHWTLMVFAAAGLIGAHLLRLPLSGKLVGNVLAFLAGLVIVALGIRLVADTSGIGRTSEFDQVVNAAAIAAKDDPAPLIVFTGASFSRNGIDDERLTLALKDAGYNYRVVSLSIEAASILERDAHLHQFMKQTGETPAAVFVEVAREFDTRPAFFFDNSKFSTRAIEQFDVNASLWTLSGLLDRQCGGTVGCVKDVVFLGAHSALNVLNVGLLSKGEHPSDADPKRAFDAHFEPRVDLTPAEIHDGLTTIPDVEPVTGPYWVSEFRLEQRAKLSDDGVKTVGYYFPPVLSPDDRAYASGLCLGELDGLPCFIADDPALLSQLDGSFWLDDEHLLDPGTAIYDRWLADQLIASGVLETSR